MTPTPAMTVIAMPTFGRYIGIDYSGAETPAMSLKGLRVYAADRSSPPAEIQPPPSPRKYWTRRGIAEWLVERLCQDRSMLIGIDHAFSFPQRYFEAHHPGCGLSGSRWGAESISGRSTAGKFRQARR